MLHFSVPPPSLLTKISLPLWEEVWSFKNLLAQEGTPSYPAWAAITSSTGRWLQQPTVTCHSPGAGTSKRAERASGVGAWPCAPWFRPTWAAVLRVLLRRTNPATAKASHALAPTASRDPGFHVVTPCFRIVFIEHVLHAKQWAQRFWDYYLPWCSLQFFGVDAVASIQRWGNRAWRVSSIGQDAEARLFGIETRLCQYKKSKYPWKTHLWKRGQDGGNKPWLCHLLAVRLWASHVASLIHGPQPVERGRWKLPTSPTRLIRNTYSLRVLGQQATGNSSGQWKRKSNSPEGYSGTSGMYGSLQNRAWTKVRNPGGTWCRTSVRGCCPWTVVLPGPRPLTPSSRSWLKLWLAASGRWPTLGSNGTRSLWRQPSWAFLVRSQNALTTPREAKIISDKEPRTLLKGVGHAEGAGEGKC